MSVRTRLTRNSHRPTRGGRRSHRWCPGRHRRRGRGRTAGLLLAVVGGFLLIGFALPGTALSGLASLASVSNSPAPANGSSSGSPTPEPPPSVPLVTPSNLTAPVLQMPGAHPTSGPGTFTYAAGEGDVLGAAGTLRRYRVAVESTLGEELPEFAATVDRVLGDPRGWTASGRLRLQRVRSGHDFTVYLVTAGTARGMCATVWVDITVDGKPYTSCRGPGKVIINLDRWRLSVDDYVTAGVPLAIYREYVINHEVGHELGHGHELCPGKGRPAPVMQTQTLGLEGCRANPWPYVDGARYTGPPA